MPDSGGFLPLETRFSLLYRHPKWIRACCRSVKMEKQDRKCPHQQATNNEKEPQQFHYNRDPDLNVHFSTSMASVLSLLTIETEPQSQGGKKTINRQETITEIHFSDKAKKIPNQPFKTNRMKLFLILLYLLYSYKAHHQKD